MQISYNGLSFLKEQEGFRAQAYKDTGGVWTIGYGTIKWKDKPVEAGMTITEKEAELALTDDLAWAQTAVNKAVRVTLTQNMFDALVSFVYNLGESNFRKSTLLNKLNQGQYKAAAFELLRWKYDNGKEIPGLLKRRQREKALFESV
jgi:lysozyme